MRNHFHYTDLELQVKAELDCLGIKYVAQHSTRTGFVIDFALLERKIALEVDGPYHDTKEQQKRDRFKDRQLKREGWEVVRIHWSELGVDGWGLVGYAWAC